MEDPVKSPRGRKPVASQEAILEAALDLVDAEGLAAFNVRRLTAALEIGPMTLYGYFESKEDLIDAMLERALGGVAAEPDPALAWTGQLTAAMQAMHAAFARHRGVVELVMSRSMSDPVIDPLREHLVAILLEAGFSHEESVDALRLLMSHALGYAILASFQHSETPAQSLRRLKSLPRKDYPHLKRVAEHYARRPTDAAYDRDLADLIRILEARLGGQ